MKTVTLTADPSPLQETLAEIRRLAESFPHIIDTLFNGSLKFSELFGADADRGATVPAGEIRIVFQPTPFLLGFMAAVRAFDRQRARTFLSASTTLGNYYRRSAMTLDELNQIEDDLRKINDLFPNDYATAKAFELAAALRPFLSPAGANQIENQSEVAQARS